MQNIIDKLMRGSNVVLSALLLLLAAGLYSCSDPSTIGVDLVPEATLGNTLFTDTITIETNVVREDSLKTDEAVAVFNLAGSYTDPVFGLSRAGFYAQVRLPNNNANFSFGTSPVLDSVVLSLAYADYYGDTITQQQFEVYRLDESMYKDSSYYSVDEILHSTQLFSGTVSIHPRDSVDLGGALKAPHLRLKLDPAIGDEFLDPANADKFLSTDAFIAFFKGIYVKALDVTASGTGCIASFNLLSSMSKLTVFYSNSAADSLSANFEINADCPRFNHYEHDYSTAEFGSVFPVSGSSRLYVQSMAGVKTHIRFPYLAALGADGDIAINKAELVVPAIENSYYKSHTNLLVFGVDSAGKDAIIPDLLESSSYYGGNYDPVYQEYKFNLARYTQRLVSGNLPGDGIDYGLSIIASGGPVNAFRTIIPGPYSVDTKLKFRITYSKLK
ncbi:MAG TPA: DUF4270 domain-containing protein [Bacteroidia bacterium]|nr:DUF4270 domain-containing protein [Bacteroidia bacterium]